MQHMQFPRRREKSLSKAEDGPRRLLQKVSGKMVQMTILPWRGGQHRNQKQHVRMAADKIGRPPLPSPPTGWWEGGNAL